MPVPKEIRAVKRPKNTIVNDNGKDGPLRYSVRERAGTTYVPGKNPQPHNGKVIGHIIDFTFVPITPDPEPAPTAASFGAVALVNSVSQDIYDDVLAVFSPDEAQTLMVLATLQIIKPGISLQRMEVEYQRTFASVYYPGVSLSPECISEFLENLGRDSERRAAFSKRRVAAVCDHHIAID